MSGLWPSVYFTHVLPLLHEKTVAVSGASTVLPGSVPADGLVH